MPIIPALDPEFYRVGLLALPMLVTAVAAVGLGCGVVFAERASRESRALLVLSVLAANWLLCFALATAAPTPAAARWWIGVAYVSIPLIPPAIYGFSAHVLRVYERRRRVLRGVWGLGFVFALLLPGSDRFVVGLRHYPWGWYPDLDLASSVPLLVFFGGVLALTLVEYSVCLRRVRSERHRARIRLLMAAFGIAHLALLDFLPSYGVPTYPFGYLAVLAFLGIAAWTVRRYRLVDLTAAFAAEQILATMADPLIVADAEGRVRIVNDATRAIFGYGEAELLGQPLEWLAAPGSAAADRLAQLRDAGVVREEEMVLRAHAGEDVAVSVSASRLQGGDGERVGTVLIAHDVRESKAAERRVREREERFRALIENITDAIVTIDATGRVGFASASLERVTGFTPEERQGESIFELIHPEDQPRVRQELEAHAATPGDSRTVQLRLLHRDGTWRDIEATATNLLHHPAVEGIVVAYHDITQRKRAEEALRQSEEQLRQAQKMEAVGRLAGGVAHDFNNLLTIVTGQARLMLDEPAPLHEMYAALEEIFRAGTRASELTHQLLALSRRQVLQPKVLDLGAVVGDVERMLRRLIGEDIRLLVSLGPDLGRVRADPGQISQVLLNLAVNARDAMPDGGVLGITGENVRIEPDDGLCRDGTSPGNYVMLSVRDTGHGMDEETLERVFEPFFTTKEQGKGTGLGLSTVYGIVKQSGGHITARSAPGEGAEFRVYLPSTGEPVAAEERDTVAADPLRGWETVLLAEDDPSVRELARQILLRRGYTVLVAENGRHALQVCAECPDPIHILLTDVVMPEMGGAELARQLARERPSARVLYMSGYTDDAIGHHGVLGPGINFLQKPFTPQRLAEMMRMTLDAPAISPLEPPAG